MSYDVRIHQPIKQQIREACGGNELLIGEVYKRLLEHLGEKTARFRPRIAIGFQNAFPYKCKVNDPCIQKREHLFWFLVEDQRDQGRFLITAFRHTERDR